MNPRPPSQPWPAEIRLNPEKSALRVEFEDGTAETIEAELLRVMSPSAEVQGHSPSERKIVSGKRSVKITHVEPVGNYAIRLDFSDRHNTGIYTWLYLYDLARNKTKHWDTYLNELDREGLKRE